MCVDMGGGSHFRERGFTGGSYGVHKKGGSQGVHEKGCSQKKGGSREPWEPPWLRACRLM